MNIFCKKGRQLRKISLSLFLWDGLYAFKELGVILLSYIWRKEESSERHVLKQKKKKKWGNQIYNHKRLAEQAVLHDPSKQNSTCMIRKMIFICLKNFCLLLLLASRRSAYIKTTTRNCIPKEASYILASWEKRLIYSEL